MISWGSKVETLPPCWDLLTWGWLGIWDPMWIGPNTYEVLAHDSSLWQLIRQRNFSTCRKIGIMRVAKHLVVLFLTLRSLWILKSKVGPNTLFMSWVCHNRSFWDKFFFTLALKTKNMFYAIINSIVISWPKLEIYKPLNVSVQVGKKGVHCCLSKNSSIVMGL